MNFSSNKNHNNKSNAKAIFEFKAGYHVLTLFPKAVQQLDFNHTGAKNGAYKLRDKQKIVNFVTNDSTNKIIVAFNYEDNFLPIFVDPKYEAILKIKLALNQISDDEISLIDQTLDAVMDVINNYTIVVIEQKDLSIKLIKDSNLYSNFMKYFSDFKSLTTTQDKISFLLNKMKGEEEVLTFIKKREEILNRISNESYKIFFNEFKKVNPRSKERLKYRTASVIRKSLLHEKFKLKNNISKYRKTINMLTKKNNEDNLKIKDTTQIEKINLNFQKALQNLNKLVVMEKSNQPNLKTPIQKEYDNLLQICVNLNDNIYNFEQLDKMIFDILFKKNNESSMIGVAFEKLVENSKELQHKICEFANLKYNDDSKFYFTHTHGNSDIDMTLV